MNQGRLSLDDFANDDEGREYFSSLLRAGTNLITEHIEEALRENRAYVIGTEYNSRDLTENYINELTNFAEQLNKHLRKTGQREIPQDRQELQRYLTDIIFSIYEQRRL